MQKYDRYGNIIAEKTLSELLGEKEVKQKLVKKKENKMEETLMKYGKKGALLFFGFLVLLGSYKIVSPGERGVLIRLGKASDVVLEEGLHLKFPLVDSVKTISIRVQKSETKTEAATKDLQKVYAEVALNWNIDPKTVNTMYQTIGDEDAILERVINPAVSESLKAATAKLTAEEVLTKRFELKQTVDEMLVKRLMNYNVVVKDISIVSLHFTQNFDKAVEEKQIAEQDAQKAKYRSHQAEQDAIAAYNTAKGQADSTLVNAQAQAKAQELLKKTLTKDLVQLEYLKKWNGVLPQIVTGNGSGMMLNLNSPVKEQE